MPPLVYNDEWVNAREMNASNPETFEWNEPPEYTDIKKGSIMKVCNGRERFWCICSKIIKTKDNKYKIVAQVDNCLIQDDLPYNLGDLIQFERDNIFTYVFKKDIKNHFKSPN